MSNTIIAEIREYLLGRFTMHTDDKVRRLDMYVTENAAELAQLRAELEMNKANLESFMQLQSEHKKLCDLVAERYKIYLKDQAEMVGLRTELEKETQFACEMRASREGWKNTAETATARAMEIRAELDEAREAIIEAVACKERYHDKAIAWLSAHPEETK